MTITLLGRIISKKNEKQIVRAGGRSFIIPSKAFKKYQNSCLLQLKSVRERHHRDIDVNYILTYKGKLWIDADNAIASINDILQKATIIDDDKQIKSGTFIVKTGAKDWKVEVEINDL